MKKLILTGMMLFSTLQTHAIEFIRIAGIASDACAASNFTCPYTLADYGLTEGQFIYFDLLVATELDDPQNPDTFIDDFFGAILLAGTEVGAFQVDAAVIARTSIYPEGSETLFFDEQGGLALGVVLPNDADTFGFEGSIDFWEPGTDIDLFVTGLLNNQGVNTSIAELQLVYRGTSLPPAVVPVPAAVWLFVSALGSLVLRRRR